MEQFRSVGEGRLYNTGEETEKDGGGVAVTLHAATITLYVPEPSC